VSLQNCRWVKDFEESTLKAAEQAEDNSSDSPNADPLTQLVTNPIVMHRMIRRFSKDLTAIVELMEPRPEESANS